MNSGNKESYDTIGLDEEIISGAKNINLSEKESAYKGVTHVPIEVKEQEKSKEEQKETSSNTMMEKVKGLFYFGQTAENTASPADNSNTAPATTDENSLKQRILKKLQDNIEVEKSYQTFFIMLLIGLGLLCVSLIFLPVIILAPYKFVLCFSFGSLIILASFIFVLGTKSYFETLFSKSRFLFTLLFLASILVGIMFAWNQYFFLSLICSCFQLISLIVFTLSFIPGGAGGIAMIGKMLKTPFTNLWMRITGQSYLPA